MWHYNNSCFGSARRKLHANGVGMKSIIMSYPNSIVGNTLLFTTGRSLMPIRMVEPCRNGFANSMDEWRLL